MGLGADLERKFHLRSLTILVLGAIFVTNGACKRPNTKTSGKESSSEETAEERFWNDSDAKLVISNDRMSYAEAESYCKNSQMLMLAADDVKKLLSEGKLNVPSSVATRAGYEFAWTEHTGQGLGKKYWYFGWKIRRVIPAPGSQGPAYAMCQGRDFSNSPTGTQQHQNWCRMIKISVHYVLNDGHQKTSEWYNCSRDTGVQDMLKRQCKDNYPQNEELNASQRETFTSIRQECTLVEPPLCTFTDMNECFAM